MHRNKNKEKKRIKWIKKDKKKDKRGKKTKKIGLMQPILCLWDSQSQAWRNAEWPFCNLWEISTTHGKKTKIKQR